MFAYHVKPRQVNMPFLKFSGGEGETNIKVTLANNSFYLKYLVVACNHLGRFVRGILLQSKRNEDTSYKQRKLKLVFFHLMTLGTY